MTSKRGSAAAREEFWLEAARLTHRRLAPGAEDETEDGTEPENPGDGEAAPDWRQDISDPATGLSRLLSERRGTCILRPADPQGWTARDRLGVRVRLRARVLASRQIL